MRTLSDCVEDLLRAFADSREQSEVVLVELSPNDFGDVRGPVVRRTSLRTVEEYRERFEELLGAGYAWINLSLYGEMDEKLLVAVELPRAPVGTQVTSVNISGPTRDVRDAGGDARVAIRLVEDEE
jgi:hypothetical protein